MSSLNAPNNRRRILLVIDSLGGGGAERAVLTLARTLLTLGHGVQLVTMIGARDYEVDFDIQIHSVNLTRAEGKRRYRNAGRRFRELAGRLEAAEGCFDLIVSHLNMSDRVVARSGVPNVHSCLHSMVSHDSLGRKNRFRRWRKLRHIRSIYNGRELITVSDGIGEDLKSLPGLDPKTVQTIYDPLDFGRIREAARGDNPYSNERYIVHVGRFSEVKRHDRLLRAYAASGLEERLVLLGQGEMRSAAETLVRELKIQDQVIFAGFTENPYPIIRDAKALVLTSDYEGFGLVLVEALALGVPAVSTDCPTGPREILTGELAEMLVPIEDQGKLAAAMKRAVKLRKEGAFRVPADALERFDVRNVARQFLALAETARFEDTS